MYRADDMALMRQPEVLEVVQQVVLGVHHHQVKDCHNTRCVVAVGKGADVAPQSGSLCRGRFVRSLADMGRFLVLSQKANFSGNRKKDIAAILHKDPSEHDSSGAW